MPCQRRQRQPRHINARGKHKRVKPRNQRTTRQRSAAHQERRHLPRQHKNHIRHQKARHRTTQQLAPRLRPKRIPSKNKEHRHVKREDRVPQRRGIWDGVPHNDQNNCNPLCNIDPVKPFASHGEPFKTAAHKMKKAETTKRSGLNKRWCSMADSNRRPWD